MSRGRGRGRGRGKPYEGLGLPPGEPAPPPILQPPPLYPTLDRRPLELRLSDVEDYLVTIKQDLKQYALKSPYYLTKTDSKSISKSTSVARYSDKYRKNGESSGIGWDIHWDYFPKELRIREKAKRGVKHKFLPTVSKLGRRRDGAKRGVASSDVANGGGHSDDGLLPRPKAKKRRVTFDDGDDGGGLVKKLESLEKAEQLSAESEQSAEEENAEEVYDEYEDEEGTDYNLTYFDNGEDYEAGGDDEALEEGPVY